MSTEDQERSDRFMAEFRARKGKAFMKIKIMSMTHDDMIEVIQAHRAGKWIEWRYKNAQPGSPFEWTPATAFFDFSGFDYRIKPEPPKPREWDLRGHSVYYVGGAGSENALADVGWELVRVREILETESA